MQQRAASDPAARAVHVTREKTGRAHNKTNHHSDDLPNKSYGPAEYQLYSFLSGPSPEEYGAAPLDYEPASRNSFVALVMGLVLAMLLVSFVPVVAVAVNENLSDIVISMSPLILIISAPLMMVASYGFAYYGYARQLPMNIILLVLGVLGTAGLLAVAAALAPPAVLLVAGAVTCLVVLACVLLALTSFDFTSYLLIVIVLLFALTAALVIAFLVKLVFGVPLTLVQIIINVAICLVQAVLMVIELQMILGGGAAEFGEEDYAPAAYCVYASAVAMFLRVLRLVALLTEYFDADD